MMKAGSVQMDPAFLAGRFFMALFFAAGNRFNPMTGGHFYKTAMDSKPVMLSFLNSCSLQKGDGFPCVQNLKK